MEKTTVANRKIPSWIDNNIAEVWCNEDGALRVVEPVQVYEFDHGTARLWWYHDSPYPPDRRWVYDTLFSRAQYRKAMQGFELIEEIV